MKSYGQLKVRIGHWQEALSRLESCAKVVLACMYCQRVYDDSAGWQQLEIIEEQDANTLLSHGICPDCATTFLPSWFPKRPG